MILTLPIETGKQYIRRDGGIITAYCTASVNGSMYSVCFGNGVGTGVDAFVHSETGCIQKVCGNYPETKSPFDLVSDYAAPKEIKQMGSAPLAHVHSKLMMEYAVDAADTPTPWMLWESRDFTIHGVAHGFVTLKMNPQWHPKMEYRRKPDPATFFTMNEFEVQNPLRRKPQIGSTYFFVSLSSNFFEEIWADTMLDNHRLQNGICHLSADAAKAHRTAILSFTKL